MKGHWNNFKTEATDWSCEVALTPAELTSQTRTCWHVDIWQLPEKYDHLQNQHWTQQERTQKDNNRDWLIDQVSQSRNARLFWMTRGVFDHINQIQWGIRTDNLTTWNSGVLGCSLNLLLVDNSGLKTYYTFVGGINSQPLAAAQILSASPAGFVHAEVLFISWHWAADGLASLSIPY